MESRIKKGNLNKKTLAILGALMIIAVLYILIACVVTEPVPPKWTGAYTATVYQDGEVNEELSNQFLLNINYEGDYSMITEEGLEEGKWRDHDDYIKAGSKKLIKNGQNLCYETDKYKVVFTTKVCS